MVACTFALKDSPHHFRDSLSFISALRRRRLATCDTLTDALLTFCQSLLKVLWATDLTHLRSPLDHNLQERLLARADTLVKSTRISCPPHGA